MKRLIKPIYSGIQIKNNEVHFDWEHDDSAKDVMFLNRSTFGSYQNTDIQCYYGYKFRSRVSSSDQKLVRDLLKGKASANFIYTEDAEKLVENCIFQFDNAADLSSYDVIVSIKPTNSDSILEVMRTYLMEYTDGPMTSLTLIKRMYRDVQFDSKKATDALKQTGRYTDEEIKHEIRFTQDKFNQLKRSGQLFQMKRFIPREIRSAFFNFLKFPNSYEYNLYKSLQGAKVLFYDDFITSGTTVLEANRYLKSINPTNTVTVLALVQQ